MGIPYPHLEECELYGARTEYEEAWRAAAATPSNVLAFGTSAATAEEVRVYVRYKQAGRALEAAHRAYLEGLARAEGWSPEFLAEELVRARPFA